MLGRAMLVIEEFCDADSHQVCDEDNRGWKVVSNAIKGRLVADDDQFTLSVCLLSQRFSGKKACHIYVLPLQDVLTQMPNDLILGDFRQIPLQQVAAFGAQHVDEVAGEGVYGSNR